MTARFDTAAFRLDAGPGAPRAFLIHGFTATPWDMRMIGEELRRRGFTVVAPLLAGHGGRWQDLEPLSWQDVYHPVSRQFLEFAAGGKASVIGHSYGALLALHLAAQHPHDVASVSALGAAMHFDRLTRALIPVIHRTRLWRFYRVQHKTRGVDSRDDFMRWNKPGYMDMPIRHVTEIWKLRNLVRRELERVTCPALIVHSRNDHTAPHTGALELTRKLRARPLELYLTEESFHVLTVDVEKELITRRVASFTQRVHAGDG
ncbi:MAG: Thermostable monoacylglycerol lipase [Myxococcota bacterium]|nr:Thermostable monoacylglycerol lipase [Myxococcota bacterium]